MADFYGTMKSLKDTGQGMPMKKKKMPMMEEGKGGGGKVAKKKSYK